MSKARRIEDLSKGELLGLIYNNVRDGYVVFRDHPCICASCGEQSIDELFYVESHFGRKGYLPLGFICDKCEEI